MFPINRTIALGPSLYYITAKNAPSFEVLSQVDKGLKYDPNAIDMLQAKVRYSYMLGKQNNADAIGAYNKLLSMAPKSNIIAQIKNLK